MTHTYQLTGMTCSSCEDKVKRALELVDNIANVEVSKENNTATITMNKHVAVADLQNALDPKYKISAIEHNETIEQTRSWFETYKPILLIFFYISLITVLIQTTNHHFDYMQAMQHFMAGFFLVFSFFKMLNLKGFAESYMMYDVVARKIPVWGYIYAFLEFGLGISYLLNFNPIFTNAVTFIVMTISIIGVLQSVLNKKKIQCACLGAVFNLPMSTVTIIEDGLMIIMSLIMLTTML
ncbi:heavy-metal-associated domain-containing protein [Flavobacterium saccharophilum]|uniref:Heavy-metal-associated domain-containing protein n=1 Tax=Flavobacterium saccharophilum TaxID=29534 RepID=A0A1M7JXV6_9FLAO|nr:heavy metal-associated domain-containing protein [Flavobacterium saccharophilum]SHM57751.1 Heavy-metal-associated domain-containing protein [Flavobacterium saccharophilum]